MLFLWVNKRRSEPKERRKGITNLNQDALICSFKAASEKHAKDIQILDLRGISDVADFFFLCSSLSSRQSRAIADEILESLRQIGYEPHHYEGYPDQGWILIDYGDVIFHIFQEDLRAHYDLEGLWCDANRVKIPHLQLASSQNQLQALTS